MEPGYRIEPDTRHRLVRITPYGFWDEATVLRYQADVRRMAAMVAKAPLSHEGFRVLLDVRDHVLLGKDHADSLRGVVGDSGHKLRVAVIVSQPGLLQRQVERVASGLQPRLFTSEPEALAWLFEGSAVPDSVAA